MHVLHEVFLLGAATVLLALSKSGINKPTISHQQYFYGGHRGYLQNSFKMTALCLHQRDSATCTDWFGKLLGKQGAVYLSGHCVPIYFCRNFSQMSWMLFKKHEILAIQGGCVATHTAVYSMLPSKYTVILVLWLLFFFFLEHHHVIVAPESSSFYSTL